MIESPQSARTARAYAAAHVARAGVLRSVLHWLFARHSVPLSREALTEPCR